MIVSWSRWLSPLSLSLLLSLWMPSSWAQGQPIIDQVWHLVSQEFFDPAFSRGQWESKRQQLLAGHYANQQQMYSAIQEALQSLGDPYTRLIDPRLSQTEESFTGIGLHLGLDRATGYVVAIAPIERSPAFEAGVMPGDLIVAIDGISTQGMELDRAIALICGQAGTKVTLSLQRQEQVLSLPIERNGVTLDPVRFQPIGEGNDRVGYIRLAHFSKTVPQQMQAAVQDLESQGVVGYVLDLRSNPGGLVEASAEVARMWLDWGTIVTLKDREGKADRLMASGSALTEKPLAILVDQGTASASEILSAALQDHRRGILVGTSTYGKGSVQALHSLDGGAGLAVTTAHYLTPQGFPIDDHGLDPDIRVELSPFDRQQLMQDPSLMATSADPQFVAALKALHVSVVAQGN